jgi:glycosyltransferase involved in cell wall biosynthesis
VNNWAAASGSRIVLLTGNSLCHNPRALKEATALARAGYCVSVLGAWLDATFKARDLRLIGELPFEFVPVLDATLPGAANRIADVAQRIGKKAAQLAYDLTGRQSPRQLGYTTAALLQHASRMPADLYISHSEPALYVAWQLMRRGRRVAVDMEDWFSQDLLPEARRHRPVDLLQFLERELLTAGACAFCPSQAMTAALVETYGCRPPTVIYNAFPWADRQGLDGSAADRQNRAIPSIYWFSTTLGPGRGIEDLVAALPFMTSDAEIHLRATAPPDFVQALRQKLPERWRSRLFLHAPVANDQLLARIAEHDIGFAGEIPYCRSRDTTVTNKILHYLLGGLPTVASDTAGQREVARQAPGAVLVYGAGNARELAGRLEELILSPARMERASSGALAAARDVFCWEQQEAPLLAAIAPLLATSVFEPAPAHAS